MYSQGRGHHIMSHPDLGVYSMHPLRVWIDCTASVSAVLVDKLQVWNVRKIEGRAATKCLVCLCSVNKGVPAPVPGNVSQLLIHLPSQINDNPRDMRIRNTHRQNGISATIEAELNLLFELLAVDF